MSGLEAGVTADFVQRVGASIASWKRKLLDLSRRNRALNFKPNKVSTIAIVDEHPAEAFRHIYLDEAAMRFRPSASATNQEPLDDDPLQIELEVNGEPHEFESESERRLAFVTGSTAYSSPGCKDRNGDLV